MRHGVTTNPALHLQRAKMMTIKQFKHLKSQPFYYLDYSPYSMTSSTVNSPSNIISRYFDLCVLNFEILGDITKDMSNSMVSSLGNRSVEISCIDINI